MTTYTLDGIAVTWDESTLGTIDVLSIEPVVFTMVVTDGYMTNYTVIDDFDGGDLPFVEINEVGGYSYSLDVSGIWGDEEVSEAFLGELYWGGGTTQIFNLDFGGNVSHIFDLTGNLPQTVSEFNVLGATITGFGVISSGPFTPGANFSPADFTGVMSTEHDRILGEDIGGNNGDLIYGDFIASGAGNDTVYGYAGADSLNGGSGADKLYGGSGKDVLQGNSGNDKAWGGDGNDSVSLGKGDDVALGGKGADILRGQVGNDILKGNAGSDKLYGGINHDTLYGGDGADTVWGGQGKDTVYLGRGDDVFYDSSQNSANGDDRVYGGGGNDVINVGGGADVLTGGSGADVFNFNTNLSSVGDNTITDFKVGIDQIGLSGESYGALDISDGDGGVMVSWDNGSAFLTGVTAADLDSGDFMF